MEVSRLRELVSYDAETGAILWLVNRRNVRPGDVAGTITAYGYRRVNLLGKLCMAHRIGWALHHGAWPKGEIDHIDGNRLNNRISNLRLATHAQNARNSKARAHNSSGLKGVKANQRTGTFGARITVNGSVKWLGSYPTAEQAHAAYVKAATILHGEFARVA